MSQRPFFLSGYRMGDSHKPLIVIRKLVSRWEQRILTV
nr:MAG TPA: hypothetical protein [Bacteriophage sp.]